MSSLSRLTVLPLLLCGLFQNLFPPFLPPHSEKEVHSGNGGISLSRYNGDRGTTSSKMMDEFVTAAPFGA